MVEKISGRGYFASCKGLVPSLRDGWTLPNHIPLQPAPSLRFPPLLHEKQPDAFPLSGLSMSQFSYAGVGTNLSEQDTCTCTGVLLQLPEVCVLSTLLQPRPAFL